MDSTMMYLHVKKTGNESVNPVKNLHTSVWALKLIWLEKIQNYCN